MAFCTMAQTVSIPKGTRDFGRTEMAERNWIFDTIKSVFRTYGYQQIETPSMENLSTLLGKYGDEGDRLLFRILNSGDAFAGLDPAKYTTEDGLDGRALASAACEKGLRYDLTVPFARYVVMHRNEITFPFKRFQIQPVWRADRPQKGRYREFYQCDVDAIGSDSLLNELELVQIVDRVFTLLGIRVAVRINNRKVLTGLAEICGAPDMVTDITVAIDKLEKIGIEKVEEELLSKGISGQAVTVIETMLGLSGTVSEKISSVRTLMNGGSASGLVSETGLKGLDETEELFALISAAGIGQSVEVDFSLARGLDYYTGAIFEVKALDYPIGSICGGGRYDNLTGIFGLADTSGVGISFGADRIYDVLKALGKFPSDLASSTCILFANMGKEELKYILPAVRALRDRGVACEIYPDPVKLRRQFEYAEKRGIRFLSINGSDEAERKTLNVKRLSDGMQRQFDYDDVDGMIDFLS